MPDLGSIGFNAQLTERSNGLTPIIALRSVRCGPMANDYLVMGARDNTQGNPAQPSLRMDSRGVWRFRWRVLVGTRTIRVDVKQAVNQSPRPTIVVRANPSIGVNSDVTETAAAGASWVTIGPATITPSSQGAVWVELHANYDGQYLQAPCYWDNVQTT